jgi:hypothetical protein
MGPDMGNGPADRDFGIGVLAAKGYVAQCILTKTDADLEVDHLLRLPAAHSRALGAGAVRERLRLGQHQASADSCPVFSPFYAYTIEGQFVWRRKRLIWDGGT